MPTRFPVDWLRGTLSLCVLGVLAEGVSYGYAITQRLEEAGLGLVKGGTLYPLLARLEAEGLVAVTWQTGDAGPNRKYVELTNAGRAELVTQQAFWRQFTASVNGLIHLTEVR